MGYLVKKDFNISVGFEVNSNQILAAAGLTNNILSDLPSSLYKSVDFKTASSVVGSIFCNVLSRETGSIVNPIEKGHPDLVPTIAQSASEEELRNYPEGLEIKCTIGSVEQGANLRAGVKRVARLAGITWQAHHREVRKLMGLTWGFASNASEFLFPLITGIFYTDMLLVSDWGAISGTSGRNTKVTGMAASGKSKMGSGWIIVLDEQLYTSAFSRFLGCRFDEASAGTPKRVSRSTRAPTSRE